MNAISVESAASMLSLPDRVDLITRQLLFMAVALDDFTAKSGELEGAGAILEGIACQISAIADVVH